MSSLVSHYVRTPNDHSIVWGHHCSAQLSQLSPSFPTLSRSSNFQSAAQLVIVASDSAATSGYRFQSKVCDYRFRVNQRFRIDKRFRIDRK